MRLVERPLQRRKGEKKAPVKGAGGGEGGIRTHGTLARTPDFESGTFDHSATSPGSKTKRALPKVRDCSRSLTMRVSPRLSAPMHDLDAQGVSTFTPPMYGHNASGTVMLPSDCW